MISPNIAKDRKTHTRFELDRILGLMALSLRTLLHAVSNSLAAATSEISCSTLTIDDGTDEALRILYSNLDALVRTAQEHGGLPPSDAIDAGNASSGFKHARDMGGGNGPGSPSSRKRAWVAASAIHAAAWESSSPSAAMATAAAARPAAAVTRDPMETMLLPELLAMVLNALTPSDLGRLARTGLYYAGRPGTVRRAVKARLVARLGPEVAARRLAWCGASYCLELAELRAEITVGSRLSGGHNHLLMRDVAGRVSSCGLNYSGQLGLGNAESLTTGVPHPVAALASIIVVQIAAGRSHSMALAADGAVWSWGDGDFGTLGHGERETKVRPPTSQPSA